MSQEKIARELERIDEILRSKAFSLEMAQASNAAYAGDSNKNDEFITAAEEKEIIYKTVRGEKIAMNLAGFYALECGMGLLCEQTKQLPVEWLVKIANDTAGSGALLLLNRFANATWKAGQPFRSPDRINQHNFRGAGFLSPQDVEKDTVQITSAASLVLKHMNMLHNSSLQAQMEAFRSLLQSTTFAFEMAQFLEAAYYTHQQQPVPLFMHDDDDLPAIPKRVSDQKIAESMAGFYALEAGINYLVTTQGVVPTDILQAIINDALNETDAILFLRLANATWKAGQPFRDLNRIERETFTPAYFLSEKDIDKDRIQIKAAARKLGETLATEA